MGFLWKLIPPPYGVIVHYGLMLAAIVAFAGFFYVKGMQHVEHADQVAHAQELAAALKLHQIHDTATRKRMDTYVQTIADLQAVPPGVVHGRVGGYVAGLCHAAAGNGPKLSAGVGGGPAGSGSDAPVRPADGASSADALAGAIDSGLLDADIEAAERNSARLRLCAGWVKDNGGIEP